MPQPQVTQMFLDDPDPQDLLGLPMETAAQMAIIGLFILIKRDVDRDAKERES